MNKRQNTGLNVWHEATGGYNGRGTAAPYTFSIAAESAEPAVKELVLSAVQNLAAPRSQYPRPPSLACMT